MASLRLVLIFALALCGSLHCEDVNEDAGAPAAESPEEVADEVTEDAGVLVLTDKNFDSAVNDKDIILVEFYAPWCGHCKSLAPEYSKAAMKLKNADPPVPLAKVDCTAETDVASRFSIQGYPTLKVFRKGVPEDYDGPREEQGIIKYMKEKSDPNYKPPPEEVIDLTEENFEEIVNKEDVMLVEFFAPWCGHCKKLAPELEKAATKLKALDTPILIGKVDATKQTKLAEKYSIQGYPDMRIFRKGEQVKYNGPRDAEGITVYMERQAGPPSREVYTFKGVKDFMKSNFDEPVILGLFEDENDPMLKLYFEANQELRDDYMFGHTFDKESRKFVGVEGSAILVVHPVHLRSKYEPKYRVLKDSKATVADIQAFYKEHHVPLVGHFQSHTEKRFTKRPLVLVFYDVDFQNVEVRSMTQFWRNKVLEVAKNHKDMLFAVAEEAQYLEKLKKAGLDDSGEEVNVVIVDSNERHYPMVDEEFSEDSLEEFIQSYLAGDVKPVVKSQIAPRKQGAVKTVVGSTFDQIVMDESKEVLIEFYAPWCGHCKALEPDYKALAEKHKGKKNLVIAKLDATANDYPPHFSVSGFPTIYWAPPGKKSTPILFEGQRTVEGFDKFLGEHSKYVTPPVDTKTKEEATDADTGKKDEL